MFWHPFRPHFGFSHDFEFEAVGPVPHPYLQRLLRKKSSLTRALQTATRWRFRAENVDTDHGIIMKCHESASESMNGMGDEAEKT